MNKSYSASVIGLFVSEFNYYQIYYFTLDVQAENASCINAISSTVQQHVTGGQTAVSSSATFNSSFF